MQPDDQKRQVGGEDQAVPFIAEEQGRPFLPEERFWQRTTLIGLERDKSGAAHYSVSEMAATMSKTISDPLAAAISDTLVCST
jgi:hypothetical protein